MDVENNQAWSPVIRIALYQAMILVILGALSAVVVNSVRHDHLSWQGAQAYAASAKSRTFRTVTPEEAFRKYQKGAIRFIDARDPADYVTGHLPDALNIPVGKAGDYLNQLKSPILSGKGLVIYCSGIDCPLSTELAEKLADQGIMDLVIMPEGWAGWYEAGLPIEERGGVR
jgi:rhodanese-related sulfurtransferase